MTNFWDQLLDRDPPPEGGHGWIQWKGTDVCMDVHCPCGYHSHVDTDFLYFVRCPECGRAFQVSQNVRLISLTPEQEAYAESQTSGIKDADR